MPVFWFSFFGIFWHILFFWHLFFWHSLAFLFISIAHLATRRPGEVEGKPCQGWEEDPASHRGWAGSHSLLQRVVRSAVFQAEADKELRQVMSLAALLLGVCPTVAAAYPRDIFQWNFSEAHGMSVLLSGASLSKFCTLSSKNLWRWYWG